MSRIIAGIAILSLSGISGAKGGPPKTIEAWECAETWDGSWRKVLLVAKIDEGRQTGEIEAAGIAQWASFQIKGVERRWDFVLDDDGYYNYAFVISPGGTGRYYDFSLEDRSKPSLVMRCRQRQP